MVFHIINFNDEETFNKYRGPDINFENCFETVYIWSQVYETYMRLEDEAIYLYSVIDDTYAFDVPKCKIDALCAYIDKIVEYCHTNKKHFSIVLTEDQNNYLISKKYKYNFTFLLDKSDYIYQTEKLSTLAGGALQSKRNLWFKFNLTYPYEFKPYTEADYQDILKFWEKNKLVRSADLKEEIDLYVFKNLNKFKLQCDILWVDKEIIGYAIYKIKENSLEILFEKGNVTYKGVYVALVKLVATKNITIPYINREDDIGLEQLRISKKSYNPCRIINKYIYKE